MENHGKIVITVEEYLRAHGVSKNKLTLGATLQRTQLQNYCRNKVTRVDLDVLARICNYLGCEIQDIMHFEK